MEKLALFDFDGTMTSKDSMFAFIKFAVGRENYYKGLFTIFPTLMRYTFKRIPNYLAKERLMVQFFRGYKTDEFKAIADKYSLEEIDKIIRPKAAEKMRWHKFKGHKVVIVSASMECWLRAWCERENIMLIATKLDTKGEKLTGKFSTKNCHGQEKVNRIKELLDLDSYEYIYAYGDSSGDTALLALADESFYKPFRNV